MFILNTYIYIYICLSSEVSFIFLSYATPEQHQRLMPVNKCFQTFTDALHVYASVVIYAYTLNGVYRITPNRRAGRGDMTLGGAAKWYIFNHFHAGSLPIEIFTKVCTCSTSRCIFQWISQPMLIELGFNFLDTLPISNEFYCTIRIFTKKEER